MTDENKARELYHKTFKMIGRAFQERYYLDKHSIEELEALSDEAQVLFYRFTQDQEALEHPKHKAVRK